MAIEIIKRALRSRTVRDSIRNSFGERSINLIKDSIEIYQEDRPNIFTRVWSIASLIGGTLVKWFIGEWTFRGAFQTLYSTFLQLKAFDWNISNAEIEEQINANNLAMYSLTGGLVGGASGWIASIGIGAGISQSIPIIGGPMLRALVLQEAVPEAIEETIANLKAWALAVAELSIKNDLLWAYKNIRSFIQEVGRSASQILGENIVTGLLEQWGHPQGQTATINNGIDWLVEQIPHQGLRAFTEEFLEEFESSFIEGGFIVAGTFDAQWQLMLADRYRTEDSFRQVAVYPDERNREEKLLLMGEQKEIMPSITNALATHDIVGGSDVGLLVGEPLKDFYRKNPLSRQLTIQFREKAERPFRMPDGSQARVWQYKIPDVKYSLNWEKVKRAARPYTWGPYRASALLTNRSKIVVWGATESEAIDKINELMELSTAEIQKISVSHDEVVNPLLRKHPTRAYPYKATLLFRKGNTSYSGLTDLDGNNYERIAESMYLWPDSEPNKVIDFSGSNNP